MGYVLAAVNCRIHRLIFNSKLMIVKNRHNNDSIDLYIVLSREGELE